MPRGGPGPKMLFGVILGVKSIMYKVFWFLNLELYGVCSGPHID